MSGPSVPTGAFGRLLRCLGAARHLAWMRHPFYPRRHHVWLACRAVSLPEPAVRRQARGFGLAGAVGVFVLIES